MAKLLLALVLSIAAAQTPTLVEEPRGGGYVLYLRHASTDFSQNDARMTSYADCSQQRNLTEKGRGEARTIGEHVKRLRIPIGQVLASPFCRTRETAQLAFGKDEAARDARGGPSTNDAERYAPLRKLLSAPVPKGENRVISSHANPFYALVGPPYLAEGEIAVVRPQNDSFTVVARIRVEDWQALK